MPNTTRMTIPYPTLAAPADVPADMQALAEQVDASAAMYGQGTIGSRPTSTPGSPGKQGRIYFATDEGVLYYDHGTGWAAVNALGVADGPAGTATLRSLGTGAQQAAAGNDARLSDQRTPIDNSVTAAKVHTGLKPSTGAGAATEALRALGTQAGRAAPGIHAAQHQYAAADPLFLSDLRQLPDAYLQQPRLVGALSWPAQSHADSGYSGYGTAITGGTVPVNAGHMLPAYLPAATGLVRQTRLVAVVFCHPVTGGAFGNFQVWAAGQTNLHVAIGDTGAQDVHELRGVWQTHTHNENASVTFNYLGNNIGTFAFYINYLALEMRYVRS